MERKDMTTLNENTDGHESFSIQRIHPPLPIEGDILDIFISLINADGKEASYDGYHRVRVEQKENGWDVHDFNDYMVASNKKDIVFPMCKSGKEIIIGFGLHIIKDNIEMHFDRAINCPICLGELTIPMFASGELIFAYYKKSKKYR